MRLLFFVFFASFFSISIFSQIDGIKSKEELILKEGGKLSTGRTLNDTINGNAFEEEIEVEYSAKTHFTDYKIISFAKDTTVVDTTLSLKKERIFNFNRKNQFEKLPLHNMGQGSNSLGYDFFTYNMFPEMGMQAKYENYYHTEDVNYYRVPTPTTELFFQTGIQQGHVLNSLITMNLNPQLNVSIGYTGLRSLGDYQNALSSHQNFRTTLSYQSQKNTYRMRAHFTGQNILNQENGGLTDDSMALYLSNDPDYQDRARLTTQFTNAESKLKTRSYYLEHGFNLWYHGIDSTHARTSYLQIGHEMTYDRKFYTYDQDKANDFFGTAYFDKIADSTYYFRNSQSAFTELKAPWVLGTLRFNANYTNYQYGYNSVLYLDNNVTIPQKIKAHTVSTNAMWKANFKTFYLNAMAGTILEGDFTGNYLGGSASFQSKDSLFTAKATLLIKSQSPQFNHLFYQSGYEAYNWYQHLENEQTRVLGFEIASDKLLDASIQFTNQDFYTYFNEQAHAVQYDENLSYLKLKAHKAVSWKKLTLDNTLMYQKVAQGSEVFHVPDWVTENTLYFSDHIFKGDPLFLQTGVTLKYFTKYYANDYQPLLSEFILQNQTKIGGYPLLDIFVNAQIKRTRLFFKMENMSSLWDGGKYLSTPTQPYRDFTLRFGLVWNFFI